MRQLVISIFALLCVAAVEQPRLDITIRPVRWQPLPDQVEAVFVGPDQRAWYLLEHAPGAEPDLSQIKLRIEREFKEKSPQVVAARPCLFERSGRVWFATEFPPRLIGYDGRSWVEHDPNGGGGAAASTAPATRPTRVAGQAAKRPRAIHGNLPDHGTWNRDSANLQIGDTLFFLMTDGVTVHDARANRFIHTVMTGDNAETGLPIVPQLLADPAGGGAIALVEGPGAERQLWRWRAGAWTRSPSPWAGREGRALRTVPMGDGAWVMFSTRNYGFFTFDGKPPANLAPLLRELAADDFAVRERATAAIKTMGPSARPWLERAHELAEPEAGPRLAAALAAMDGKDEKVSIGSAQLDFVDWIRPAGPRHVVIAGHDRAARVGYRTFLIGSGGVASGELDAATLKAYGTPWAQDSGCVPAADKPDHIWMPRAADGYAALMDLKAARIVDRLPEANFNWLHATTATGTLYVSAAPPAQRALARPVIVYQPAAPDDRVALKSMLVPIASKAFCVASDGAVWAEFPDAGVVRFDGKAWKPVPGLPGPRGVTALLPGANGEIVVVDSLSISMVDAKGAIVRATTLEELIEQHRPAIVAAFPAAKFRPGSSIVLLFCDPAGNVWLKRGGPWKVLTKAGGQDGNLAAKAAAGKTYSASQFCPMGDGRRVYLSEGNFPRGFTFLAGVGDDGKLQFDKAPHTFHDVQFRDVIVDRGGAAFQSGAPVRRVDAAGKIEDLPVAGTPCLCDADGNVWIGPGFNQFSNELTLWRDGKVRQTLSVPSFGSGSYLLADRAGSVCIRNNGGLHHLVARPGTGKYELAKTYAVDDIPGWMNPESSSLGYIVVQSTKGLPVQYRLHLVELPR